METAVILCENGFGRTRGKTAAGLVRHSLRFKILAVIDSAQSGKDAGEVLGGERTDIPIVSSVEETLSQMEEKPDWMIIGVATIGGMLPPEFRRPIKVAIENGVNIISGLHEWLANDAEFSELSKAHGVKIVDIRKERPLDQMHYYKGLAEKIEAVRIPVLGTDAACGKRTTGILLAKELNARGIKTSFVATGQTGLLQGSKYGVPIDAIRGDYVVGELEHAIWQAWEEEKPQVIVIEGQGALGHPAYVTGSRAIVSASKPSTVVLQHAPGRKYRSYHADELRLPNGTVEREMELVRICAQSDVMAITLNHENLTRAQVKAYMDEYEDRYGVPVCDVLVDGPGKVVDAIVRRFFPNHHG